MKNLEMALCFLDEDNNIVVKEDLNVSWNLEENEDNGMIENIIVMDKVAEMLTYQIQENLYYRVRELLEKAKGR